MAHFAVFRRDHDREKNAWSPRALGYLLGLPILTLNQRWILLLAVGTVVAYLAEGQSCQSVRQVNLPGKSGWPLALDLDNTGRVYTATSLAHKIQTWLMKPGGNQAQPVGPERPGFVATFLPDGATLVVGGDSVVTLWDLEGQQPRRVLPTGDGRTHALAVSRDSRLIAAAGERAVFVWDERSGWNRKIPSLGVHEITALALAPRGQRLATGGKDGHIRIWDVTTGEQQLRIEAHGWHVNLLTFSDDGKVLVSASNTERTAKIHDVATGQLLVTLRGHRARILSLAFVPGTELVATAAADGTVRLWDVHSGEERACLNLDANALLVSAVACSRDGRMLAATDGGERLLVWDRLKVLMSPAPRR